MRTPKVAYALVIGAGSGMGRASAEALSRRGITVFSADLDPLTAQGTAHFLRQEGAQSKGFVVDVSLPESVRQLFQALRKEAPRLDLMVHTAAILGKTAPIEEVTDDQWRRMMAVNLDGTFYCCREAVRWMKEAGGGRIILFSSVAALSPTPAALPYSSAKGGVTMLARTLAAEVARHNIRVNVIAPGYFRTPMLEGLPEGFKDYVLKKTPLGRLGEPQEIGALVAYLASPEADFFTGQVLSPNGGWVI